MVSKSVPHDLELALDHHEVVVDLALELLKRAPLQVLHLVEVLDEPDQIDRDCADDGPGDGQVLVKEGHKEGYRRVDLKRVARLLSLESRGRLWSHVPESQEDALQSWHDSSDGWVIGGRLDLLVVKVAHEPSEELLV